LGTTGATRGSAGTLVREYGILLAPAGPGPFPAVIAFADATDSAADVTGLTDRLAPSVQFARRLALSGYVVFTPFFIERRPFSEPWTDDRDWLFRLGFQVGHHLIGSEVQQVSSAVDFLSTLPQVDKARLGVVGSGQGGLTGLYTMAVETRLKAALVSGYFGRRDKAYEEPEDRTLWKHLVRFGDAEIAFMAAPRVLIVESAGNPEARPEFEKVRTLYGQLDAGSAIFWAASPEAGWERLDAVLKPTAAPADRSSTLRLESDRVAQVANAQFTEWQAFYKNLAMEAYAVREAAWRADFSSIEDYRRWAEPKLEAYLDMIGRYPATTGPLEAQSVKIYDEPGFTGYRLSVRVYDDVHAYGILLVPKGMHSGERRPVVFTEHGLGGKPEDALGVIENPKADQLYARFGMRLAQRGYIVFAPMISTQDSVERQKLDRRAYLVGLTPVGLEIKKFGRVLDFLSTLPFVDEDRFAFYGLSYGGYTALWTGPAEPRFKVVICSGHFNDWDLKTTDLTEGTSYAFYPNDLDMYNFDILHSFNHADIAWLVAPRAFMVEIGDRDSVIIVPRCFVDAELARVEELYRCLGISERGRIARFDGPHRIDGKQAFPFLDQWLGWTPKSE
jgi:dienelactone hydrolase